MPARILISACLFGEPVRHDGQAKTIDHPIVARWRSECRLVPVCPEMLGGLPTPRPPAEIQGEGGGAAVLAGKAAVHDNQGYDVTAMFVAGAERVRAIAADEGAVAALLIDKSPSCGSTVIYDGSFSGAALPGEGVTAALLRQAGIAVFNPSQLEEADRFLGQRD